MPEDLTRKAASARNLGSWRAIGDLARLFDVTPTAMSIRLQELGYIFGIAKNGAILLSDPAHKDQEVLL